LSQSKNLTVFSGSSKTFVLAKKNNFTECKSFLVWHKKFGPAQKILGPVKGQGIFEKSSYHASIVRA
jgi:hypothetical protein